MLVFFTTNEAFAIADNLFHGWKLTGRGSTVNPGKKKEKREKSPKGHGPSGLLRLAVGCTYGVQKALVYEVLTVPSLTETEAEPSVKVTVKSQEDCRAGLSPF